MQNKNKKFLSSNYLTSGLNRLRFSWFLRSFVIAKKKILICISTIYFIRMHKKENNILCSIRMEISFFFLLIVSLVLCVLNLILRVYVRNKKYVSELLPIFFDCNLV